VVPARLIAEDDVRIPRLAVPQACIARWTARARSVAVRQAQRPANPTANPLSNKRLPTRREASSPLVVSSRARDPAHLPVARRRKSTIYLARSSGGDRARRHGRVAARRRTRSSLRSADSRARGVVDARVGARPCNEHWVPEVLARQRRHYQGDGERFAISQALIVRKPCTRRGRR